jgi:hypothetical protein
MKLKQISKDNLVESLVDWHTEAFYADRSSFKTNDDGAEIGKDYIKFEAMLKIIKKLIREAK